jgi:hypothetical protein
MNEHHSKYDIDRFNRPPTLSEYATAKKEYEIGVDEGSGDDTTVVVLVSRKTLLDVYWNSIPNDEKRKIKIGDHHDPKFNKIRP